MDLQILKNNLLFNHTYLKELTADTTIDPKIPFSPTDLSDWYSFLDTSSIETMVDTWIRPMLSLLELEIHSLDSDDEHVFKLTTAYDHTSAIGVCYVAPPGADLDTTTKGWFWMAQAVLAARRHTPALRWVILTNGDFWRLLDAQALRRYEAYVQIDVGQLARGASDPSALRVFFRCFHRSAFEKTDNKTGLEKLLETSDHATEKAEKHLKDLISGSDGIMAQLSLGLVRSAGKSRFSEEERDAIYRDATTLLYRMLFLLFAESRQLLPIDNPKYAELSMGNLVEMARRGQQRGLDRPQAKELWERLKRLSNAIYESDPALDIPAYNGGLFDDDDHPYLRDGTIADQYLSRALYDLAFLPNGNDLQVIDYRDLSVRHLGSLYEGMIEYKLFVAEEPMLARRDKKGNIHFMSQKEGDGLRRNDQEIKAGEVYFAQSSGERRATGTYYTPEYIVDYIVQNTVLKGLEARRAPLEEKLKTWLDEIQITDSDDHPNLQRTVDDELLKFVHEQVLTFTVCDPAMGSGHFLVNAAYQIDDFIVETLCLNTWGNVNLDLDPIVWRRRVAERCLYGVDISEMAVELAKLSLWLATMSQGKPLSFLKHHLRQGNSLAGVPLEDLSSLLDQSMPTTTTPSRMEKKLLASGQLSMLEDPAFNTHLTAATNLLRRITDRIAETVSDVKTQEVEFEQVENELAVYKIIAHLILVSSLDTIIGKQDIQTILINKGKSGIGISPAYREKITAVIQVASKFNFFHWWLEFPEVFFHPKNLGVSQGNGFDCIIGNPPYGLVRDPIMKSFISNNYKACDYQIDTFVAFTERAIGLTHDQGYHSFITPTTLLVEHYFGKLRNFILSNSHVKEILHFKYPVFEGVTVESAIYFLRVHNDKKPAGEKPMVKVGFVWTRNEIEHRKINYKLIDQGSFDKLPGKDFNISVSGQQSDLVFKLMSESISIPLGEIADIIVGIKPYQTGKGVPKQTSETVKNRVFDIDNPIDNTHQQYLMGRDINRYMLSPDKQRWISYGPWLAEPRPSAPFFDPVKILIRQTGDSIIAVIDTNQFLTLNNLHNVRIRDGNYDYYYVLSILNSKLITYFHQLLVPEAGRTFAEVKIVDIINIPIRKITKFISPDIHKLSSEKYWSLYTNLCDNRINEYTVLDYVEQQLIQQPKQINTIQDFLAFLAKQMIKINSQKQYEVKRFLNWLQCETGVALDELSGKSILQNFLGDYQKGDTHLSENELLAFLDKNKRRLTIDPSERGFRKTLGRRYQESLDLLLPLKQRLAITDRLIDQIVYRLYGLTEEDIAIVEGKA